MPLLTRPVALACLALASSRPSALAEPCSGPDSCAADEGGDYFAALQKRVQPHDHAGAGAEREPARPKWRDALEAERAFFAKADASMLELKKQQWKKRHPHHWKPPHPHPGDKKVFVENAQATPQPPPFGPYQHSPDYTTAEFTPPQPLKRLPEVYSSNGLLDVTLVVDAAWVEVPGTGIRILTRVYNGSYPGPTLRVKRGDQVNIKIVNNLGKNDCPDLMWARREGQATYQFPDGIPEDHPYYQDVGQKPGNPFDMKGKTNNLHLPNTTNFHTHGWHVSPHEPQDNVVDVTINPGESYQYKYELSPYHSSGSSWYHAHWHGAVTMQTIGGMIGAMLIDDSPGEAPDWITSAREETLVLHEANWEYFGPKWMQFLPTDEEQGCFPFGAVFNMRCALAHRTGLIANLSGDRLWRLQYEDGWGYEVDEIIPVSNFFSVNGQYRPTTSMQTGEWVRFRFIYGTADLSLNPIFDAEDESVAAGCEMWLIAKDSAWLEEIPRKVTKGLWLGAGNRAQVMVRCSKPGMVMIRNNITQYLFTSIDPHQTLLYINVTGEEASMPPPPKSKPQRPRYLQSLVNIPYSEIYDPEVPPAENVYNGKPLETPDLPMKANKTIGQFMTYSFPNDSPGKTPIYATAYENQPVRFVIQNMTFSHDRPMATFPVAEIIEVEAGGLETHWWHMHTNPAQYVEFSQPDYYETWGGYFEIGDWHDVLALPGYYYDVRGGRQQAKVRFQTDCYQGVLIVHCHVLYHEDLGMMTWFNATGPNHKTNPKFQNTGIFEKAPQQCTKPGQQCAPKWCAEEYEYGPSR